VQVLRTRTPEAKIVALDESQRCAAMWVAGIGIQAFGARTLRNFVVWKETVAIASVRLIDPAKQFRTCLVRVVREVVKMENLVKKYS
jgi:hypothetical protein